MSSAPSALARFQASRAAQQLFHASPVTLGLGRVALGLLLLFDVARRWTDLDVWYTNAGLLPNHTMLWAPQSKLGLSIFFSVSQLHEARFFVAVIALVYVALLVGWRTRLMQVLALVAQVSLNCRVHFLTNGGDVALSVLLLWSAFLPLGEWLSVDALLAQLRHSRVQRGADGVASLLTDPQHPELFGAPTPRFQWAAGGVALQLAVIYFFNFIHKDGSGWREGRVVLDVLHQDRIATALAVWVRPALTPFLSNALTQSTLVVEAALPVLLLLPLKSLWVRRGSVLVGVSLHVGFAAFLNVGVFSASMVCLWLLLVPHEDAVRLVRWVSGARARGTLYFDSDCGVCTTVAKTLLCLQSTSVAGPGFVVKGNEAAPGDQGVTAEQVEASVLWVGAGGRKVWQAHAFAELARTFALLRPVAWVFDLGLAQRAYDAFAVRRHVFSGYFGLGTCGLTHAPEPFDVEPQSTRTARTVRARAGLVALAFVFVCFVVQVLAQNRAVPQALKPTPPFFVEWLVEYAHFYQGWGMFAESPRTDATVVVRATTVDGRVVDPLSERASPRSPPALTQIDDRLDHDEFWCDYLSRIADDRAYQPPLRDWLLAYPRRTGNPKDELSSFQVIQLTDVSPTWGESQPTDRKQRVVLSWP